MSLELLRRVKELEASMADIQAQLKLLQAQASQQEPEPKRRKTKVDFDSFEGSVNDG